MALPGGGRATKAPTGRAITDVPVQRGALEATELPPLTVIIPTRNEAGNVRPLVAALESCLGGHPAEVLFVDDSTDETPDVVRAVALESSFPVRLLHRDDSERIGGLGGAVLAGLAKVTTPWVVVMDGDLQHPPEMAARLVRNGVVEGADIVIGSRYLPEGDNSGLSGARRVAVSRGAGLLARLLFPLRLRGVTDSMSGLFALRVETVQKVDLQPYGFKILLEVLARTPKLRISELPFTFGERVSGESKASLREGLHFARHLGRLRLSVLRHARLGRVAVFGAVGLTGIAVNSAAFWAAQSVGMHYLLAAVVATQASTLWNFLGTNAMVFSGSKRRGLATRLISFAAANEVLLLARLPLLALFVHLGMPALIANVSTLLLTFVVRFAISERLFTPEGTS